MKFVKWAFIGLVVITLGLLGIGFVLPDKAHVERSIDIDSPPATVYTVLDGFRQFDKWSPWAHLDPDLKMIDDGPAVGVGAKQSWHSDKPSVGSGSQEIIEAVPNRRVVVRLSFGGLDSENSGTYTLFPVEGGTRVVWSYDTNFRGDLFNRYVGLFMDRLIGPSYGQGLASLKRLVEGLPQDDVGSLDATVVKVESQSIIYISAAGDPTEAPGLQAAAYAKLRAHLQRLGVTANGSPLAITRAYDDESRIWRFDAALPTADAQAQADPGSGIQVGKTYAGRAIRVRHEGSPEHLEDVYRQLSIYRQVSGFEVNGDAWEVYHTDSNASGRPVTEIYLPVR